MAAGLRALRSGSAVLAKYMGWVTALESRAGENGVNRTSGRPGRETAAQPAAAACPPRPDDHQRVRLRPPVPHRGGTAIRGLQPVLLGLAILITTSLPFDEWTRVSVLSA